MVAKTKTVSTEVDVDVDVDLDDFSDDELRQELHERAIEVGPSLLSVMAEPVVMEWLRKSNPPKEVRDAYYEEFGRIL